MFFFYFYNRSYFTNANSRFENLCNLMKLTFEKKIFFFFFQIFFFDVEPTSSSSSSNSQVRGIATDMAILDSTYFLSQVILSGIMGYIVHITGTVLSYIITAGVMGIFSCIFTTKIIINKQDILQYVRVSRTRTIL